MARSSADDEGLKRACEEAIARTGTKQTVVMSIRVAKSRGIWSKTARLGRQHMAKPRVLALSTKFSSKSQKTKAFLRVLRDSNEGGILEPVKLYKLSIYQKLKLFQTTQLAVPSCWVLVTLEVKSVAPPQWTMRNIDDRNRLLLCILNTCREILHFPKVVGIDIVEMALWAKICHGNW